MTPSEHDRSSRGWVWIPASLLALGLGAIVMLVGANWIRESLIAGRIDLVRAVGEVQTRTAIAHLWVEELVTGDDVDRDSIAEHLVRATRRMEFMVETVPGVGGYWIGDPSEGSTAALTERAHAKLLTFAAMSHERQAGFDAGRDVSIGSPIDVRYDSVFLDLLSDLRTIEESLNAQLVLAETRSDQLFHVMLGVWLAIVGLAVFALWNQERRRRAAEHALHESEAQLLQAQKMEAVGRLAGGIAHDINNHLAAITAQCELVKIGAGDESPTERMDAVLRTASKSSRLIRRLLAFGRQQPVRRETFDPNAVVDGLTEMLRGLMSEDLRLDVELSPAVWSVEMDPSQLEQVVLNLVVNARDALEPGGTVEVTTCNASVEPGAVHAQRAPAEGAWLVLTVTDDGCGIEPAVLDRIFEPFFTTKDSATGSGLGLATIHGIVRQAGGHVTVESTPGRGATFRVFLPRSVAAPLAPVAAAKDEDLPFARSSASVLLVEDNDDLRESTKLILESLGYAVTAASSADQALAIHGGSRGLFELLITDVIMPGMDGKQLADELRKSDPGLAVVFVSGYTDDVILARGVDSEKLNFLEKPFSALALRNAAAAALARAGAPLRRSA